MLSSLLQKTSEPSDPTAVAMVLACSGVADVVIPIIPPRTTPAPGGNLLFRSHRRVSVVTDVVEVKGRGLRGSG